MEIMFKFFHVKEMNSCAPNSIKGGILNLEELTSATAVVQLTGGLLVAHEFMA